MRALKLGTLFRIPVYVHWSFGLIILFIIYTALSEGMNIQQIVAFSLYVLSVFICVIMHEYGHALMARKYHIPTKDIIILPIGGLARLQSLPDKPTGELMIAIAGPLVNLVLALLCYLVLKVLGVGLVFPDTDALSILTNPVGFIHLLLFLNVVLFVFNLVPAYPMDGGRILRAFLCFFMSKRRATFIAALIGKVLAVAFVIIGIYNIIPTFVLIGVFIFVMAGREYQSLVAQENMQNWS